MILEYLELFAEGLGKSKGSSIHFKLKAEITPIFFNACQVTVALLPKVDKAIEVLIQESVYQPVYSSRWATPMVCIVKKNGTIRPCGDYQSTFTQAIKTETYLLPTTDKLFFFLTLQGALPSHS